ncbi:hypothetical protein BD311DRAFT_867821 [Dichomitus squalens]|uniref:Uncharacterized protein n=1 Tax=Dichomitus squalens TaxID=114155 RepID=A0A4Q9MCC6_9APHY|nr:hypothetical protein BD311DRAFT_867821 [Dichomitus squalens]
MHRHARSFSRVHRRRALGSSPVYFMNPEATNARGVFLGPGGQVIASGNGIIEPPAASEPGQPSNPIFETPQPVAITQQQPNIDKQAELGADQFTTISVPFTGVTAISQIPSSLPITQPAVQSTAGVSSMAGLTSESIPATTLVPSSSTITTSLSAAPLEGSANSTAPTSKLNSVEPSTNKYNAGLYAGIAFGSIAGVSLLLALLAYWLRVRSRTHRQSMSRMTTWPWDHDRLGAREDTMNGGGGKSSALQNWNASRMVEASDVGKQRFSIEEDLPWPPGTGLQNNLALPLPSAPPQIHLKSPYLGSPFVTIPLHAAGTVSVQDMTQDIGALKIINLMPGDITSGGETSRASTALGIRDDSSVDFDTPTQEHPHPKFHEGRMNGPRMAWEPLRPRKSGLGWQDGKMLEDGDDIPLPFPGGNTPCAADVGAKQEGWASSIRSNLFNALSAVVGGNASQVTLAQTNDSDNLTWPPERRTSQRHRGIRGPRESAGSISQLGNANSTSSATGRKLEETSQGIGVAHILGHSEEGSSLTTVTSTAYPRALPPALPTTCEQGELLHMDSVLSVATRDPMTSVNFGDSSYPPRLPRIPSVSRSSTEEAPETGPARKKTRPAGRDRSQYRTRTKKRRPTVITRKSSSQSSAMSVGSDMSRTTSVASEGLTDAERFAKHVLRERRRRVMEMTVGRCKTSRSRATTISRRRPKEKLRQMLEREDS